MDFCKTIDDQQQSVGKCCDAKIHEEDAQCISTQEWYYFQSYNEGGRINLLSSSDASEDEDEEGEEESEEGSEPVESVKHPLIEPGKTLC